MSVKILLITMGIMGAFVANAAKKEGEFSFAAGRPKTYVTEIPDGDGDFFVTTLTTQKEKGTGAEIVTKEEHNYTPQDNYSVSHPMKPLSEVKKDE